MKRLLILMILSLLIINCENNPSKSNDKLKGECFILCEGNFGSNNSSLWQYDGKDTQGPVYWDLTTNTLGDVGQSLTIDDNRLFIIVNNSHNIEVLDLESLDNLETISLPFSSPRYFAVKDNFGYVSSWGAQGIIKVDLNSYTAVDTISVGALPEYMIVDGNMMYVSITMNSMWGSENKVFSYDLSMNSPVALDTFEVVSGPGKMLLKDNELWVASTYYDDAWQSYAGMSKIDLITKNVITKDYGVTFDFARDLIEFDGSVYQTYSDGIVKIGNDLNFITAEKIGTLSKKVYSANVKDNKIYLGTTDYAAPDTVFVLNKDGEIEDELKVGAIPAAMVFMK